jgi:2Fe-2S ferredoxin
MPVIHYIEADGTKHVVETDVGVSVMQAAVDNGIDGILAECGGCCSCATCHCFVDEAWVGHLPEPDVMEKGLLKCVSEPRPNSRLSCQIEITEQLDGLVVRLPESQF